MFRLFALFVLFFGSVVHAETVEVPLLPDGTVDLDAIIPTFRVSSPNYEAGISPTFEGSFLGQPFLAFYDDADINKPFELTIRATTLSEHGNYLVALFLNDIICLRSELRPGKLMWRETSKDLGDGWKVKLSCEREV